MKIRFTQLICFLLLFVFNWTNSQTFSNNTIALQGSWNGTLTRTINVSGLSNLQTGILELAQVNVHLGRQADASLNYSSYKLTLTSPAGTVFTLINSGNLHTSIKEYNSKFRDNIYLTAPSSNSSFYEPFDIGYYKSTQPFSNFNTENPNGIWTVTITETSSTSAARYNNVDLVFRSAYTVQDYTTLNSYDNCATPYCLGTAEIIVAKNAGFTSQATDMVNSNTSGCSWNAAQNNSAWFKFIALSTNVKITISGITNNIQILGISSSGANPCNSTNNTVLAGGCPTSAINDTYLSPQYINGSSGNNQLNMSGLTPGQTYYFIVDGTGGAISPFYIETTGTRPDCANCVATIAGTLTTCVAGTTQLTGSGTPASSNPWMSSTPGVATISSTGLVTGVTIGTTQITYTDNAGCSKIEAVVVEGLPIITGALGVCTGTTNQLFGDGVAAGTLPWTSSNTSVATIDNTGLVTVLSVGSTTITYTNNLGCSATALITSNSCGFGSFASAVWIKNCATPLNSLPIPAGQFFNTTGSGANLINPTSPSGSFMTSMGSYIRNSGTLTLAGAELKTFKNIIGNVCGVTMYYNIHLQSATAGTFTSLPLNFFSDCNTSLNTFNVGGGPCNARDQKWQTVTSGLVDLTILATGNYVLEIYYTILGDNNSTTQCDDLITLNNGGLNYVATFSLQDTPIFTNSNPTTCSGADGTITISGLTPNIAYDLSYIDDSMAIGPLTITSNAIGQIIISNLNSGTYSNFLLAFNGCSSLNNSPITLMDPLTPTVSVNSPQICGNTATVTAVPGTGVVGDYSFVWTVPGTASAIGDISSFTTNVAGSYSVVITNPITSCSSTSVTSTVVISPNPTFGNLTATTPICSGGNAVFALSGTANATVSYTINTGANQTVVLNATGNATVSINAVTTNTTILLSQISLGTCNTILNNAITVIVNQIVTPTFNFGTAITNCYGVSAQIILPLTSSNSINGIWSPSTINNAILGDTVYTFTPNNGQCATTTLLTVTVNALPEFTISSGCDGTDYILSIVQNSTSNSIFTWYNSLHEIIGTDSFVIITDEDDYSVVVRTNNCNLEQQITVSNSYCGIQKGISPNNDNLNDNFELSNLSVKELQIYNRYGMEVYSKMNYTNEWGGKANNGNELPDGTYYYVIHFNNGKIKTGWIYINREN